jgi:rhodanese-related sulfurtransferase
MVLWTTLHLPVIIICESGGDSAGLVAKILSTYGLGSVVGENGDLPRAPLL